MPIYEYCCKNCSFSKDILQKLSEDSVTICPSCETPNFEKQITAAGFQLKGAGWYATDFRGTPIQKTNSEEQSEKNISGTTTASSLKPDNSHT
jgi:putative FmdB family regulatory protein